MDNLNLQTTTYLFGVFSDYCDSVSLEKTVSKYSDHKQAFFYITTILVAAVLEKIALSLSKSDLNQLILMLNQKVTKNEIRNWLDSRIPNATLLLTESVELSLFGLAELSL